MGSVELEVKEEPEVDLGKKKKTVSSPILTLIGKSFKIRIKETEEDPDLGSDQKEP